MEQINIREHARLQHRAITNFCLIQCWIHNWDGVRLKREFLKRLIGLERFKQSRLQWMSEDIRESFPHQNPDYQQGYDASLSTIEISRVPFEKNPYIGEIRIWDSPTHEHLVKMHEGFISFLVEALNQDERLLVSYLSLLSQEQKPPQLIPSIKKMQ